MVPVKLGQIVRYAVPVAKGEQHFARGRVIAREQYDHEAMRLVLFLHGSKQRASESARTEGGKW